MSDDGGGGGGGGTDNPAFSNDEDTASCNNSTSTASAGGGGHSHHSDSEQQQQGASNADHKTIIENGKNGSFVSQHYVEPAQTSPEPKFTSETRIELPEESASEKTTATPKPKQNGVNGNGNNNDVSFLNTTVTSVTNNDVNDTKEQIEAVNLELVSMKPYAGTNNMQTKNQEACELPADPYEEYFVPVNEHRKCIRGEKLYVTKDKRSTSSYWRRVVCWGCGFLIIAIAAIIAILAGTGVILTQEATQPLLNGDKTSYRQLNDAQTAGSQEYIKNPPPSPPPVTSTFPPWQTTDETLYKLVPKALDGVIKLDDLEWNDDMNDPKSRVYRDVAKDIESSLVNMFRLNNDMPVIKVYSISKDGEIKFRVGQPVFEKPEDNQDYLENKFRENGSVISKYHVNRLTFNSLVDQCHSENMGCSDNCLYDYVEGMFTCTCPTGKILDKSGKKCVNNNDLSNINYEETISDDVQGRSRMHDDIYHTEDHWKDAHYDVHGKHDESTSKTTSESEPSVEPKSEPEPTAEPKSEPEPDAETTNEPEPAAEPASEPEPSAEPKGEPEPAVEPTSEPEPAAEPASVPEPTADPKSEPEPAAEPASEPEPSAEPKSEPEPAAEPASEPEPSAEPKSEPEPAAEPASEPEPSTEPKSEPEPAAEPASEPEPSAEPKSEPEPAAEPASEPEPSAEPKSELEPAAEPASEPEPSAEPKSEPEPASEPASEPEPSAESKSEREPAVEPTSEPETIAQPSSEQESASKTNSQSEPAAEPASEPEPSADPTGEPEPAAEPVSEPGPEAVPNIEPESSGEPKSEPEPADEPTSEPEPPVEPKSEPEPVAVPTSEPEPAVEPKSEPEPTAEPKIEPELVAETTTKLEPATEPKSEAEPTAEPKSELDAAAESVSEPEPAADPKGEFEPSAEPKSKPESAPESTSEPTAEPKDEPEPSAEPESAAEPASKPEPAAEPKSEPELSAESINSPGVTSGSNNESELTLESASKLEPVAEFTSGPEVPTELPMFSDEQADQPKRESELSTIIKHDAPEGEVVHTYESEHKSLIENMQQKSSTENKTEVESSELSNGMEANTETHDMKKVLGVEPTRDIEISTILPSEPVTVIGLNNDKEMHENDDTTELNNEQYTSTETPLEVLPTKELKNNTNLGKEFVKKAPRLDKDEQDNPNPFESNIKDVVTSNINDNVTETTISYNYPGSMINETNNHSVENAPVTKEIESSSIEKTEMHEKEHDVPELNKENAEDQYNDITDEFVPKGYGKNDLELSQDVKQDEKKVQKVYKEIKNHTNSKTNIEHTEPAMPSTTDGGLDKHFEDPSMTSQVPILPIEIQNDMSTTETVEKADMQTTSQEPDKEIILITNQPKSSHVDGKTTEQIPILPEELQTTDANKPEQSTESTSDYQIGKRIDESSSEADVKESDKLHASDSSSINDQLDMNIQSATSNDEIIEEINDKTTMNYNILIDKNETTADIKPVSESIVDDTTPQSFEYKFQITTTTEKPELPNEFEELTEEQLRVVPLEERDAFKKTTDDQQMKFKKEKELIFETSSEFFNNADMKSGRNVEDDNIPKLTSGTSESNINSRDIIKTLDRPHTFDDINIHGMNKRNETELNTSSTTYPNFIPVSEEIEEDDYRFTEPSIILPFNNQRVITTNLPELNSNTERSIGIEENDNIKSSTELQTHGIREASTSSTLVENTSTENTNKSDENSMNAKQSEDKEHKTAITSKPEDHPEVLGIPVAILTVENVTPTIFFSKCKSGQFQCVNGTSRDGAYCVNLSAKCDSENDCSDGSDEVNCEEEGCPGNFQCASGQCLKRHLVCNGIVDCDDGSDEKECGKWKCNFDEFQCPNGRCIPVLWQCDSRPDCENHADEYSCSESCGNDEYLCPIEKWCIPQTWHCNGVSECVNGEDEKLCECALDQFKCETGGCIPAEQLCDGVENCPDRSDEWDCLSAFSKNSTSSTELDKENKENEFSTRSSLVKIRQSSGDYRFICSDGWTDEFSDHYCRTLGFASSESTQFVEQGTKQNFLQLISNASPNSSLVINLEKIDSCKSEKIVEVSCQEFSCGSHESVGPTARLVGGTPASVGQWSSVALLKEPKYGAACTASVLSPMHALASYSCIHSYRQSSGWQLFVGGNLLKPHKVKNFVPYPQVKYNQFLYNNDIALVELAEPLVFSRNVSAVCLPSQSLQPRQLCVTAGWGFPVNGEVDLQQYLKFLPVPTYDSEECNATSHYAGFITKNNICAGFTDTDKGPCYNDEGAPLMCVSETGRWEIQGLLSHHSRCSRGHPAIYSSLAPALSWLRNSVPALQAHT